MICIFTLNLYDGRMAWFLVWTCSLTKSPGFVFGLSSRWSIHIQQSSEKKRSEVHKSTSSLQGFHIGNPIVCQILFGTSISFPKNRSSLWWCAFCQELKEVLQKSLVRGASKVWMDGRRTTRFFSVQKYGYHKTKGTHTSAYSSGACQICENKNTHLIHTPDKPKQWNLRKNACSFWNMKKNIYPETIHFCWSAEVLAEHRGHRMNRERFHRKANDEERNGSSNSDTSRLSFPKFFCCWEEFEELLKWRWHWVRFFLDMLRSCIVC